MIFFLFCFSFLFLEIVPYHFNAVKEWSFVVKLAEESTVSHSQCFFSTALISSPRSTHTPPFLPLSLYTPPPPFLSLSLSLSLAQFLFLTSNDVCLTSFRLLDITKKVFNFYLFFKSHPSDFVVEKCMNFSSLWV